MSVARVRFVTAGAGLGMPESLYESVEAQRGGRERVQLTLRVRLDEDRRLPHHVPDVSRLLLVWCQAAMLDGHRPSGPSRCTAFEMW
jgi:hypothetical protein